MSRSVTWSKTVTFFEDDWHEGNVPIMGVRTHAAWLCTSVFDGARAFEGVTPDLDLHCARVNESAKVMSLKPLVSTETWMALAREGLQALRSRCRTLYTADVLARGCGARRGAAGPGNDALVPYALCRTVAKADRHRDHVIAVPPSDARIRAGGCQGRLPLSQQCARHDRSAVARLRQLPDVRHAGQHRRTRHRECLHGQGRRGVYAGGQRHLSRRHHPRAGHGALAHGGITVVETTLRYSDFQTADEIFSTGNYTKVSPVTRLDDRNLQPGPVYHQARELYWDYAHYGA